MRYLVKWFSRGTEFVAATMLAAMFITFLLQIFSRYVLHQPFGWTLELCLILWVWIVFWGNAFLVRERDHVTFDILYLAAPRRVRIMMGLIAAGAIVAGTIWAAYPTWDYVDFMRIRRTMTVENPFTGQKIRMRTIFYIYLIFMAAITLRYTWRFVSILRNGPPDEEHKLVDEDRA